MLPGEIPLDTTQVLLEVEATEITVSANAFLSGRVMRYMADNMPNMTAFHLHTAAPLKNAITAADLKHLVTVRPGIQHLTLNGLPDVVTDADMMQVIQTLNDLVAFSTNFPLNDQHVQALLERHHRLEVLNPANRKNLSAEMQGRICNIWNNC